MAELWKYYGSTMETWETELREGGQRSPQASPILADWFLGYRRGFDELMRVLWKLWVVISANLECRLIKYVIIFIENFSLVLAYYMSHQIPGRVGTSTVVDACFSAFVIFNDHLNSPSHSSG